MEIKSCNKMLADGFWAQWRQSHANGKNCNWYGSFASAEYKMIDEGGRIMEGHQRPCRLRYRRKLPELSEFRCERLLLSSHRRTDDVGLEFLDEFHIIHFYARDRILHQDENLTQSHLIHLFSLREFIFLLIATKRFLLFLLRACVPYIRIRARMCVCVCNIFIWRRLSCCSSADTL